MNLVPRESPGYGTFATTKNWIMLWDPEKAVEFGIEGTAAVLVHELWHLVRDHFGRFSGPTINADIANIAGDLSINPGVRQMGFKFPKAPEKKGKKTQSCEGLWPDDFGLPENLSAEQYYEKLMQMEINYVYVDGCGGNDDDGEEGKGKKGKKSSGGITVTVEGCGSCSGRKRKDEPEDGDSEGRTENEIRRTKITIAKQIKQQGRGNTPGDLDRWADDILKPPKVRWQEKLARTARAAVSYRPGSGVATYSKVSRRQAGIGFGPGMPVLPSYRSTTPRATLLVDTSGSMSQENLQTIMSEAQGVFNTCGAVLDVVVCDAGVHGSKTVKSIKEACAMLHGGGGSDFRPAFEEISKRRPRTSVIIAATDGDIAVPECEPPGIQVIWLLVKNMYSSGRFRKPCNWGTTIEVE